MLIYDIKTEYMENPMGIDVPSPRMSWKLRTTLCNAVQISYRIHAYDTDTKKLLWDSGLVQSEQTHAISWNGPKLVSRQRVSWSVECAVKGQDPKTMNEIIETSFSPQATFEMGLLSPDEWSASWIEPEITVDITQSKPSPYLRKVFQVKSGLKKARIYQSAHGLYEFWINGHAGTEDKFKPGFTSYNKRLQVQTYDILPYLKEGKNCWSIALGDGWWRGTIGGQMNNTFGYKLAYIGQIELIYEDGIKEYVLTDADFKVSTGGLLSSDMIFGDLYDAALEPENWKSAEYADTSWHSPLVIADQNLEKKSLFSTRGVPVREAEKFLPEVLHTPDGNTVLDFKQNIAGYVSMTLHNCQKGQHITLIHGEALDENGNFTQKNYAQTEIAQTKTTQKVEYIAAGKKDEAYCPLFSIFGFRYVLLKGYDGDILPGDFQAIAVYSHMKETGRFTCSNPLINQLAANSLWSQKGNFMDVPTDCPTRERNPYTGDAQVYAATAADFMDVYAFFEKWMLDYTEEQFVSGKIPNTVPSISALNHNDAEQSRRDQNFALMEDGPMKEMALAMKATKENGNFIDGSSGWADAATIIPRTMYLSYGDLQIYRNQFECCKKWVDYIRREAAQSNPVFADFPYYQTPEDSCYVWDSGFHWGEWLEADIDIYADMYGYIGKLMTCPEYLSATMYYYLSAKIVSEMADLLGETADKEKYAGIAANVKRVYNKYFIPENGIIIEGRQALHVRALAFDLVIPEKKQAVADYLFQLVKDNDYSLNTGFLSTPYLLPVLADNGYEAAAYRLLERENNPGWLKPVKDGATTIPESWNGFETCSSSFNHYSYGAVCDFLFKYTAGIRPVIEYPGYKKILIQPVPGGHLTQAEAEFESIYGTIVSGWEKTDDYIHYKIEIPTNTVATIRLRGCHEDYNYIKTGYPKSSYHEETIEIPVGSGKWTFTLKG